MTNTKSWLLTFPTILEEGKIKDKLTKILEKYPDKQKETQKLFDGDPTTNKKYFTWMFAKLFDASDVEKSTIVDEIISVIATYESNITKLPLDKRDISMFKTLGELRGFLDEFLGELQRSKQAKKERNIKNFTSQIEGVKKEHILFEDENFLIVAPQNKNESCIVGRDTKWCIAATQSQNYFDSYFSRGIVFLIIINKPLYANTPKNTKSKTALAISFNQEKLQGIEMFDSADNNLGNFAVKNDEYYKITGQDEQGNVIHVKIGQQMTEEVWQQLAKQTSNEVVQFVKDLDGNEINKLNPKNMLLADIRKKILNGEQIKDLLKDLQRVDLQGVDLRRANLEGANLEGANLKEANLEGTNLIGVNLEGVNLEGVELQNAITDLESAMRLNADLPVINKENLYEFIAAVEKYGKQNYYADEFINFFNEPIEKELVRWFMNKSLQEIVRWASAFNYSFVLNNEGKIEYENLFEEGQLTRSLEKIFTWYENHQIRIHVDKTIVTGCNVEGKVKEDLKKYIKKQKSNVWESRKNKTITLKIKLLKS